MITDIQRTGSGHSKRFSEPLAVADGDGIRYHPAATANTKDPAAPASARVPTGHRPPTLIAVSQSRAALRVLQFAAPGESRSIIRNRGNMTPRTSGAAAPGTQFALLGSSAA